MTAVADALGVSRQHLSTMRNKHPPRRRGRPPLPDVKLVTDIRALVADLPIHGIAGCMRCSISKPSKPGAQRPTRSASTAS